MASCYRCTLPGARTCPAYFGYYRYPGDNTRRSSSSERARSAYGRGTGGEPERSQTIGSKGFRFAGIEFSIGFSDIEDYRRGAAGGGEGCEGCYVTWVLLLLSAELPNGSSFEFFPDGPPSSYSVTRLFPESMETLVRLSYTLLSRVSGETPEFRS